MVQRGNLKSTFQQFHFQQAQENNRDKAASQERLANGAWVSLAKHISPSSSSHSQ